MGKKLTGSLYSFKVSATNVIANFDMGKALIVIRDDLIGKTKTSGQGLIVKTAEGTKLLKEVKEDIANNKCKFPMIVVGFFGKDIIMLVTDKEFPSYEESCVLVKDYKAICEKLKDDKALVVNLDKGNKTIDKAAKDMSKAKGTTAVTKDKVEYGGISGSKPIILLAHGDEDKSSTGQIYGKDFAGKTPQQLVSMLLDNKDVKKRLSLDYSGTIYLDGCFTAQGGAMQNYTKQVWELLKSRGMGKVKVKGNLGLAATLENGQEEITTSEAKKAASKLKVKFKKEFDNKLKLIKSRLDEIKKLRFKGKKSDDYKTDPEVVMLMQGSEKLVESYEEMLKKELKKIPGYEVRDFVGTFGLEVLN